MTVVIANPGSRSRRLSLTAFLSASPHPAGTALRYLAGAGRVGGHRALSLAAPFGVPASAPLGRYWLIVCLLGGRGCHVAGRVDVVRGYRVKIVIGSHPRAVTPALDAPGATGQRISTAGGTLTATAADGARFRLTIPAGAVPAPTLVTMTPLSGLAGTGLTGGLAAGVELSPEGLVLYRPATLDITPAVRVPVARQVGFGFAAGGADYHLEPLALGSRVRLYVSHFSGYGLGNGSSTGVPAPASGLAAFVQQAAALANTQRQSLITGAPPPNPNFNLELQAIFDAAYDQVVEPQLAGAGQSLQAFQQATQTFFTWERLAQSFGVDTGGRSAAGTQMWQQAFAQVWNRERVRCDGKFPNAPELQIVQQLGRVGLSLGLLEPPQVSAATTRCSPVLALDYAIASTAAYTVPYSQGLETGTDTESRAIGLTGTVKLTFVASGASATTTSEAGTGTVSWGQSSWSYATSGTGPTNAGNVCTTFDQQAITATSPGSLTVNSLVIGQPVAGGLPPLALDVTVGGISETWHDTFNGNGCAGSVVADYQRSTLEDELASYHQQAGDSVTRIAPASGPETVRLTFDTGWAPGSGSVVARRSFAGTYTAGLGGSADWTETFTLVKTG